MMHMGIMQYLATKRMRCSYEKLRSPMRVGKRCWVKSVNGRLRGLRLSKSRKLSFGAFSMVLFSSRVVRICSDIVDRIMNMENNIVFPTQWGLPVLSHPSLVCRRSVIPLDRKVMTFY